MFLVCFVLNEVFLIVCCNTPNLTNKAIKLNDIGHQSTNGTEDTVKNTGDENLWERRIGWCLVCSSHRSTSSRKSIPPPSDSVTH